MTQYTLQIPSVMGRAVWHKFFDEFHSNPTKVVQQSTNGYPVTDIYTDDNHNQVIEMALAGFRKEDIKVETQSNQITISSEGVEALVNGRKSRIARRGFEKTFVDYNNELELSDSKVTFEHGLLKIEISMKQHKMPKILDIK